MLTSSRWISIFCILLLLAGCGKIRSYKWDFNPKKHSNKDIEKFFVLHKARWWNYYERGLAFMAGGFWEEAMGDFKKSLSEIREDQHGARTYGLNRIDYYANRETGIAYYKTGEYTEARRHLEKSLKSVETSRTQYYLRKVFKNAPNIDIQQIEPPTIKVEHPKASVGENGIYEVKVEERIVELRIFIKDKNYFIDSIWLDDKRLFFELGKKRFEFEIYEKLDYGDKLIEIKARNLAGKEDSRKIHLIRTKPSKQIFFQNKFIARATALKPNVLTEIVMYPAIFEKTASLVRFAAKGGYNLLDLSQISDPSNKRDEQHSDSSIDEYMPDELLPPEDRYRILVIPFRCLELRERLPSGRYLDEVLYKELAKALQEDDRFSYVDLEENELIEIETELDNEERFQIKAVKEVIEKSLQDHIIDGILIGSIGPVDQMDKGILIETRLRQAIVKLHDLEEFKEKILTASNQREIKFDDDDVWQFAHDLEDKIRSKFPLKDGKVSKVKRNYFVCDFKANDPPLRKKMKLMIFERDSTMLDIQGKIYRVTTKKEARDCKVQARYCIKGEGEELEVGDIVITK